MTATGAIVATGGVAAPIIAGPLAAIFAGAGAGGLAGGIIGGLTGIGVPESRASEYASELERGGILVGVEARPGDERAVSRILNDRDYSAAPPPRKPRAITGTYAAAGRDDVLTQAQAEDAASVRRV